MLELGGRERIRPALVPLLAGTALGVVRPSVGTALAAAAGSMMTFGDAEHRRRAAVLLGVGATVAVAVIVANAAGHQHIDRDERDLESDIVSELTGFRSVDLVTGAFDDTWDQVGEAIGTRPSFVVGIESVPLRFDITPAIAPWLTRCLVASVEPITDHAIARGDITMETISESC